MTGHPFGPASEARPQTNLVARCVLCGVEWQVKGEGTDDKACAFCGCARVNVFSETPDYRQGGRKGREYVYYL